MFLVAHITLPFVQFSTSSPRSTTTNNAWLIGWARPAPTLYEDFFVLHCQTAHSADFLRLKRSVILVSSSTSPLARRLLLTGSVKCRPHSLGRSDGTTKRHNRDHEPVASTTTVSLVGAAQTSSCRPRLDVAAPLSSLSGHRAVVPKSLGTPIDFASTYASIPSIPASRPIPLDLNPPRGA
jgi:hypothetical protein